MDRNKVVLTVVILFFLSLSTLGEVGITDSKSDDTPIFILMGESLNQDYVGSCYGNDLNNAPNICELAKDGVLFEQAYAQGVWTPVAIPSFTTSRTGKSVGMKNWDYQISENVTTFFDVYSKEGYETEVFTVRGGGVSSYNWFNGGGEIKNIGSLEEYDLQNPDRTISLIFWRDEAHTPYDPPEELREWDNVNMTSSELTETGPKWHDFKNKIPEEQLKLLYQEEIKVIDSEAGSFVDRLKSKGMYEDSLIIFMGDHGEGFGENEKFANHGGPPYEDVIRTPLVIKFPDQKYAGTQIKEPVRHVDIPHTMMDYMRINEDLGTVGQSFMPLFEENSLPILQEVYNPLIFSVENSKKSWMVRDRKFKFILHNTEESCENGARAEAELFNLEKDPKEENDIIGKQEHQDKVRNLRNKLCKLYNSETDLTVKEESTEEDVKERLKELGYLN